MLKIWKFYVKNCATRLFGKEDKSPERRGDSLERRGDSPERRKDSSKKGFDFHQRWGDPLENLGEIMEGQKPISPQDKHKRRKMPSRWL